MSASRFTPGLRTRRSRYSDWKSSEYFYRSHEGPSSRTITWTVFQHNWHNGRPYTRIQRGRTVKTRDTDPAIDSLTLADTGHWYAWTKLPETDAVFRDNGPPTHLATALLCGDRISIFRLWCLNGEKFAVSDVLESPETVSALGNHPL